jgi:hypothetical protein
MTRRLSIVFFIALVAATPRAWAYASDPVSPIWLPCTVTEVKAFASRVHLRCQPVMNYPIFFAVPNDGSPLAQQIVTMGVAARTSGHQVTVLFDMVAHDEASFGCKPSDCRRVFDISY